MSILPTKLKIRQHYICMMLSLLATGEIEFLTDGLRTNVKLHIETLLITLLKQWEWWFRPITFGNQRFTG